MVIINGNRKIFFDSAHLSTNKKDCLRRSERREGIVIQREENVMDRH